MHNKLYLSILFVTLSFSSFAEKVQYSSLNSQASNQQNLSRDQNDHIAKDVAQIAEIMDEFNQKCSILKKEMLHAKNNLNKENEKIILQKSNDLTLLAEEYTKNLNQLHIQSHEAKTYINLIVEQLHLVKELNNQSYSDDKFKELLAQNIKNQKNLTQYTLYLQVKLGLIDSNTIMQ